MRRDDGPKRSEARGGDGLETLLSTPAAEDSSEPEHDSVSDTGDAESVDASAEWPVEAGAILEDIEWIVRSENRLRILYRIRESPRDLTELQRTLGVHRTTLCRNMEELERKDWVRSSMDGKTVRLAPAGRLFVDAFDGLMEAAVLTNRLGSFLDAFPESFPVDVEQLRRCRLTTPGTADPHAPIFRLFTLVEQATSLSVSTPALGPTTARAIAHRVSDGTRVDLVVNADTIDSLRHEFPSLLETVTRSEDATLLVATETPSYGIYLLDETAVLVAYDRDERIHSLVEATVEQEPIFEWARRQFREQKTGADRYERDPEN